MMSIHRCLPTLISAGLDPALVIGRNSALVTDRNSVKRVRLREPTARQLEPIDA